MMAHCNESKTKQDLLIEKLKGQSWRGLVVDASNSVIGESVGYRVTESTPDSWQQRVIDEKAELDIKINALANFLDVSTRPCLPEEDLEDLVLQYGTMQEYSKILERRISRFPKELKVCDSNP
jgi:hypothetical protein